ncbi:serine/threonine-protein kinase [Thermomonospora catenispora]|uniref:serine/threonine-protein kinase n=1 Tax=Thermomonospora catenispora TaxID=2493090 RepID=UPI00111DCCE6|nr:serine/threonine-protein kinase [Thermomonospora catenispora]TNY36961.1 serine/threonine protein kinase [Thermomonospora catenispora]
MANDRPDEGAGRLIAGRYRLESVLGRGGMGTVWRARDEMLDRLVAVKEVRVRDELDEAARRQVRERTLREARATARLSHPGIVTVHDVVDVDDRPWIVMELIRARSLADLLEREGPLPPERAAEIGRQMVAALRHAHAVGILHRDIKPANVLITDEGRAVLTDFGIAQMEGDATLTQTGLVMGSPAYLPPERARAERATPASDLWSLGATLYAAVEGRPPYDRPDMMAVLAALMTEDPPPPRNAGPLAPVIGGLLVRDPARRLTAPQAEEMLAQVASGGRPAQPSPAARAAGTPPAPPGGATLPAALPTAAAPARSAVHPALLVLVGALAAVAVTLAVVLVVRPDDDPRQGAVQGGAAAQTTPAVVSGQDGGPRTPDDTAVPLEPTRPASPSAPPGLRPVSGPGYRIAVPVGWRRMEQGASVFWRDPDSEAYVQVDRTPWSGDPLSHWEWWESEVLAKGSLRDYRRVSLSRVTGLPYDAADLEFTWTNAGGTPMRGLDRGVKVDGRPYAVFIAIPQSDWDANVERVNNILDTFRP